MQITLRYKGKRNERPELFTGLIEGGGGGWWGSPSSLILHLIWLLHSELSGRKFKCGLLPRRELLLGCYTSDCSKKLTAPLYWNSTVDSWNHPLSYYLYPNSRRTFMFRARRLQQTTCQFHRCRHCSPLQPRTGTFLSQEELTEETILRRQYCSHSRLIRPPWRISSRICSIDTWTRLFCQRSTTNSSIFTTGEEILLKLSNVRKCW